MTELLYEHHLLGSNWDFVGDDGAKLEQYSVDLCE